ncbi:hypothetical protein Ddye_025665 [Dipteronia dyeriana]|uniref:Uncharacterized protein n=1 Tax=Dipteronia dyeriana TaxID=168575 RepID=A0AAD9TLS2_9ROSI|nr:hypothetical protein Ddye_025665 [Dipteronia dyeriana]
MKIDIEVISRDMIKPSTPTPHRFRKYQFSFLDQIAPPDDFSFIYFFNLDCKLSNNDVSNHLKTSLSKVLTHYYPLAGRVNDNYVDCNDEGVLFLEVQVGCQLSQILREPFLEEVNRFIPVPDGVGNLTLAIQVNLFKCGNVAVCARMSHKIADASSFLTFIKNWAATARHLETNVICPEFVAAKVFSPKDDGGLDIYMGAAEKNIVLKRCEFRNSAIAALKERYAHKSTAENLIRPTRVDALSTFIWSRFSASTQTKIGPEEPLLLFNAVNLRKRVNHPLPDDSFGNFFQDAVTISLQDNREDCYSLVNKLRESVSRIDKDYVKKLQDGTNELANLQQRMAQLGVNKGAIVKFYFSSLCWYPVYETDFGWGRPVLVAWGGLAYKNFVVFMDTKSGDGIEAWIHLKEEDMAKFLTDRELLAYVSAVSS